LGATTTIIFVAVAGLLNVGSVTRQSYEWSGKREIVVNFEKTIIVQEPKRFIVGEGLGLNIHDNEAPVAFVVHREEDHRVVEQILRTDTWRADTIAETSIEEG